MNREVDRHRDGAEQHPGCERCPKEVHDPLAQERFDEHETAHHNSGPKEHVREKTDR